MKISELSLAGAIAGTEVFPIVQGGTTKKVSIADALAGTGSGSTGVNGLNGTTNIGLGGTLANATAINADSFSFEFNTVNTFNLIDDAALTTNFEFGNSAIKTFYNNEQIGINLNFLSDTYIIGRFTSDINARTYLRSTPNTIDIYANEAYFLGGDIAELYGTINTIIKTSQFITTRNVNDDITGLSFDVLNFNFKFGDLQFDNFIEFNNIARGNVVLNAQNYFTTKNAGVELGLKLDFANNQYFFGGNPGVNGSTFIVDNFNGFISIKGPSADTTALNFDMVGQIYEFGDILGGIGKLTIRPNDAYFTRGLSMIFDDINVKIGDYNTSGNLTILEVDDFNRVIKTTSRGNEIGFRFDFANEGYFFGDYGVTGHGLSLDNANGISNLFFPTILLSTGNASGFGANGNQTSIGDIDGNGNSTILGVDDNSNSITVSGSVIVNSGNLIGDRLKVRINGSDYLIVLETP